MRRDEGVHGCDLGRSPFGRQRVQPLLGGRDVVVALRDPDRVARGDGSFTRRRRWMFRARGEKHAGAAPWVIRGLIDEPCIALFGGFGGKSGRGSRPQRNLELEVGR